MLLDAPTAPTVAIESPEELAKLYVPTEIIGTVEDDNLLRYTLEYSQKDRNVWIVFATGDIPVNNGVLGTLDTTLMQNGLYDIRLTAEDASGNLETVETIYQIDGNMKIGIFTLTFTDLTIEKNVSRAKPPRRKVFSFFAGFAALRERRKRSAGGRMDSNRPGRRQHSKSLCDLLSARNHAA